MGGTQQTSGKMEEVIDSTGNCYNPVKYPELSIAHHLSRRYTTPYLKTFFTDMGANVINMQSGPCMDFELNALECIEYYGAKQGLTACKDWYDDYIECVHKSKQNLRVNLPPMFPQAASAGSHVLLLALGSLQLLSSIQQEDT